MADKYHSDTQEMAEELSYAPGIKTSGDLETGPSPITAPAEASGLGNADYSVAMTLPAPDDARLIVRAIGARISATIDSITASSVYCRVYVDAQDADHRLFDEDWTGTGNQLDAATCKAGTLQTIFDLLKDGTEHTFYVFLWVDAGDAVISEMQLWEGVGTDALNNYTYAALEVVHTGFCQWAVIAYAEGSGARTCRVTQASSVNYVIKLNFTIDGGLAYINGAKVWIGGSVATDLNYISDFVALLRSEP